MNEIEIALGPETDLAPFIARNLPDGTFRKVVIKPNWVLHETDPNHPIAALVTDARVIAGTVRAAAELFPQAERITVGDCPLQRADWEAPKSTRLEKKPTPAKPAKSPKRKR